MAVLGGFGAINGIPSLELTNGLGVDLIDKTNTLTGGRIDSFSYWGVNVVSIRLRVWRVVGSDYVLVSESEVFQGYDTLNEYQDAYENPKVRALASPIYALDGDLIGLWAVNDGSLGGGFVAMAAESGGQVVGKLVGPFDNISDTRSIASFGTGVSGYSLCVEVQGEAGVVDPGEPPVDPGEQPVDPGTGIELVAGGGATQISPTSISVNNTAAHFANSDIALTEKTYIEVEASNPGGWMFGVSNGVNVGNWVTVAELSLWYTSNGFHYGAGWSSVYLDSSNQANDTRIGIAIDPVAKKFWVQNTGGWIGTGVQNPETGEGGQDWSFTENPHLHVGCGGDGAGLIEVSLITTQGTAYAVPQGYVNAGDSNTPSECVDYGITAGSWILGSNVYFEDNIYGYLVPDGGTSTQQRNAYYDKPIVSTEKRYMEAYWHTVNVSGNFVFGLSNNITEQVDRFYLTQNTVAFQIAEGAATSVMINGTNVSTLTDPATNYQDVIALGVDYSAQTVEFFKNDISYGVIDISSIISGPLYFAVTMNPIAKVYFRDTLIKQKYTNDAAYIPIGGRGSYEQDTFGDIGANLTSVGNTVSQQSGGFANSTAYISNPIHVNKKKYFEVEITQFDEYEIAFRLDFDFQSNRPSGAGGVAMLGNGPSSTNVYYESGSLGSWGPDTVNADGDIIGIGYDHDGHIVRMWRNGVEQDSKDLPALMNFSAGGLPVWVGIGHRGTCSSNIRTKRSEFTYPTPDDFSPLGEYDCVPPTNNIVGTLGPIRTGIFSTYSNDNASSTINTSIGAICTTIEGDPSPPNGYIVGSLGVINTYINASVDNSETLLYYSTHDWTTNASSTPANTHFQPRVVNPGNISRNINIDEPGVVKTSLGVVKLSNVDGALDNLGDYAFDGQKLEVYRGKASSTFPDDFTLVRSSVIDDISYTSDHINFNEKDNLSLLERPILNEVFTGTGGIEGSSDWENKKKQRVLGVFEETTLPVQLVDASKLIYFIGRGVGDILTGVNSSGHSPNLVNENTLSSNIYEGGTWIPRAANYSNKTEIETIWPANGQCRFYIGTEGTYVRLGSTPTYELRCKVVFVEPYPLYKVLQEVLPTAVTGNITIAPTGVYVQDESYTYASYLKELAVSRGIYFWQDSAGVLQKGSLIEPGNGGVITGTIKHTFTTRDIKSITLKPEIPYYQIDFKSSKAYPSEPAGGASNEDKEILRRTGYHKTSTYKDPSILNFHRSSEHKEITTNAELSDAFIVDLLEVYSSVYALDRKVIEVELAAGSISDSILTLSLLDVVSIEHPRYSLSAGKTMIVIGIRQDSLTRKFKYTLWG